MGETERELRFANNTRQDVIHYSMRLPTLYDTIIKESPEVYVVSVFCVFKAPEK